VKNPTLIEPSCHCGRTNAAGKLLKLAACCVRYRNDFENTPDPGAESLMRSRYSAFALIRASLATWHTSTRPADVSPDDGTKWLGLDLRRHVVTDAEHAQLEFVAR
jgi:SEC-C motif-containing protein